MVWICELKFNTKAEAMAHAFDTLNDVGDEFKVYEEGDRDKC